jgi:hypothetical protein
MQATELIKKGVIPVFCISLITACNHVDEVTPRSYVGLVVGDLEPQRQIVAGALSSGTVVPNVGPLKLVPANSSKTVPMDFGWITASGTIVVHNKDYGVVLIQEPRTLKGEVVWSCVVYPAAAKPKVCGSESSAP